MVEYETSRFCSSIDTFLYTMIGCTASVVDDADFAEKDTTEISQLTTTATPIEEICTVDESGVNDEFEPVKAATPKEYLALYGEDQIVTEYFQCAPLENVIYVNKGTGILIYENGIEIGWMSQYELMEPYNARESFDYDVFDHFSGSTTSGEFVKDQIKQNKCGEDYHVSYYTVRKGAYTYGDTEWLVEQGIFRTIEEALKEAYYGHRVYIYREGSPYAYILQVNEYLVDENELEILIDNILITEKGYETKYSDSPVNAGVLYVPKTYEDICENRNAENITYTIEIDDILYKIASGCVALKMHEGYWKIYYYETCGECNVGYVEVINNEKEIETFLRENDTNYDESQLIVNGDFNASDAVSAAGIRKTSNGAG